jgi:hypothetical protein
MDLQLGSYKRPTISIPEKNSDDNATVSLMDVLVRDGKRQVLTRVARVVTNTAGNKEVQEKITNLERQMEQLYHIVKANDEETGNRMAMLERNYAP